MSTTSTTTERHPATALYPNKPGFKPSSAVVIGGVILRKEPIEYNTCRKTVSLKVRNTGDRPIQVGSHFHFFEVNRYLEFDRDAALGCHLNIPATAAIRFEPGDEKQVEVVAFSGKQRVIGFNNLTDGYTGGEDAPFYSPIRTHAQCKMRKYGFRHTEEAAPTETETKKEK